MSIKKLKPGQVLYGEDALALAKEALAMASKAPATETDAGF